MSRIFSSHSLLRSIFDEAREIRMLTIPYYRPSSIPEIRTDSQVQLHLPDAQSPFQYLIGMGLRPTLARHISSIYMEFVARYRQVFRSHFCRVIRGGCHLQPDYYRDMFVVQFRVTIQVWGSQLMSTVWAWLCRAGLHPAVSHPQYMDIRVDDSMKVKILSRLGLKPTSLLTSSDHSISRSKEGSQVETMFSIKPRPVPPAPSLVETTATTCDLFRREAPSTCFPAFYPLPQSESVPSSQRTFATAFAPTPSVRNDEKQLAKRCANMSSLINLFSRMATTVHDVGPELRGSCKDNWTPKFQKKVPLSPLLPPNILDVSGPSNGHQPMTGSVSSATSAATPRKRRIAALPKRHTETPNSMSTRSSPSPLPSGSSLTLFYPSNATSHTSVELATKSAVTENAHPDCVLSPPRISYVRSTSSVQTQAATLGPTSKSVVSKQRKSHPLPRRANSRSEPAPSPRQVSASPTLPELRVCTSSRPVLRTPSLVSDTSGIDSSPSSDELDTPPSTPSSSSLALPTHGNNTLAFPAMSTLGKQSLGNAKPPKPRDKGIHIDFTKGRVGNDSEERTFTFTFSS